MKGKQRETTSIRVTPRTNAALNIVVTKLKLQQPGKRVTQDEAIWHLIEQTDPETAAMVEKQSPSTDVKTEEN